MRKSFCVRIYYNKGRTVVSRSRRRRGMLVRHDPISVREFSLQSASKPALPVRIIGGIGMSRRNFRFLRRCDGPVRSARRSFRACREGRCRIGRLSSLAFSDVRLSSVRSARRSVLFGECVFCRRSRAGSRARALNVFPDERIATIFLFSGKSLSLRARQSGHGSHKQTSINSLNVKKWSH